MNRLIEIITSVNNVVNSAVWGLPGLISPTALAQDTVRSGLRPPLRFSLNLGVTEKRAKGLEITRISSP